VSKKQRKKSKRRLRAARTRNGKALVELVLDFQMVEEMLKRYLDSAFSIIRERTAGVLPYRPDRSTVEKLSLGKLISEFAKYSDDPGLVSELRALVEHRNYCAHRAFMEIALAERGSADERNAEATRLSNIRLQFRRARVRLMEHLRTVGATAGNLLNASLDGA
jgi:hypothetical protein